MSKFLKVIVNLFLIAAILVAAALLVPPLLGVTTTIVDTEAMDTNLPMGSVTYSRDINVMDIQNGDKILKESGASTYAYIIKEGNPGSGQFKAVNAMNPGGQAEEITLRNHVSRVVLTVPYIGYVIVAMHSIEGIIIVALVVLFMIILFVLSELWKRDSEDDDEAEEDEDYEDDESEEESLRGDDGTYEDDEDEDEDDPRELRRARKAEKKRQKAEAKEAARKAKEEAKAAKRAKRAGEPSIVSREDDLEDFPVASAEEYESAAQEAVSAAAVEKMDVPKEKPDLFAELEAESGNDRTDVTASLANALAGLGAAEITEAAAIEVPEIEPAAEDIEVPVVEPDAVEIEAPVVEPAAEDIEAPVAEPVYEDIEAPVVVPEAEDIEAPAVEPAAQNIEAPKIGAAGPEAGAPDYEAAVEEIREAVEDPDERKKYANTFIPVARPTLDELIEEAEKNGDNPKLIKDTATGVMLVDYTDIL